MENKGTKIIAVIALAVAVSGFTIGFAAFSNTLSISSSAEVSPEGSKFDVNFSTSGTEELPGTVTPTLNPTSVNNFTADNATINNDSAPTITGLHANFTEPGQKAEYNFYVHNAGEYIAYLNSVTFANIEQQTSSKKCTAKEGTTQSLVDAACEDINITVQVGENVYQASEANITGKSLELDAYSPVKVTIEYKINSNINIADGDFDVAFGDITLTYSSVD